MKGNNEKKCIDMKSHENTKRKEIERDVGASLEERERGGGRERGRERERDR